MPSLTGRACANRDNYVDAQPKREGVKAMEGNGRGGGSERERERIIRIEGVESGRGSSVR